MSPVYSLNVAGKGRLMHKIFPPSTFSPTHRLSPHSPHRLNCSVQQFGIITLCHIAPCTIPVYRTMEDMMLFCAGFDTLISFVLAASRTHTSLKVLVFM